MERVRVVNVLEALRQANAVLVGFFASFAGVPVQGSAEELKALREVERALRAIAPYLANRSDSSEAGEVRLEFDRYQINLLLLHQELTSMQSSALHCRRSLFLRAKHLQGVMAWNAASRDTI